MARARRLAVTASCSSRSPSTTRATRWKPRKSIATASQTGHATNIIEGLAVRMQATALPVS
jgi:Na+/H+-translocating membrane pyrophosphatase